jgi:Plasmid pRiA4b ORF-3-like protein
VAKRVGKKINRTATRRPDLRIVRGEEELTVREADGPTDRSPHPRGSAVPPGGDGATIDLTAFASQLADPGASPQQQVMAVTAAALHDILGCRFPLEVESVLCSLLGMLAPVDPQEQDVDPQDVDPQDVDPQETVEIQEAMLATLTEAFAATGGVAGLAGLRAVAAISPSAVRARAGREADALAATVGPEPRWAAMIGRPRFVRAWQYGDVFGSQSSVGLLFDYGRRQHAFAVLIDHSLGGGVKDCFLVEGRPATRMRDDVREQLEADPTALFEDVDAETAARTLLQALAAPPCPVEPDQVEDVATYLALLSSRTAWLAEMSGLPVPGEQTDDGGRHDVLRVMVTLTGTEPPVWRRVEVPATLTLSRLHVVLQGVFGWQGEHPHAFEVPPPARVRQLLAGAAPAPIRPTGERRTRIGPLLRAVGDTLLYRYPVGGGWEHHLVLESRGEPEAGLAYPRCTDGRRNAPPEGCGGAPGYERLLQTLADPEHGDAVPAVTQGFDPAAFSVEQADAALTRLR